jgi:hypothetical protein
MALTFKRNDRQLEGKLDRGLEITRTRKEYDPVEMVEVDYTEKVYIFQSDLDMAMQEIDEQITALNERKVRLGARKARLTQVYQSAS